VDKNRARKMKITTASMRRRRRARPRLPPPPSPCPLPCRATDGPRGRSQSIPPPGPGYLFLHTCSDSDCFNFTVARRCFCSSASSERTVEPCKHATTHGAVEQRCGQTPVPIASFSAKVAHHSCNVFTARNHVIAYRVLTGSANSVLSEPAGPEEILRDGSRRRLGSPGDEGSRAERVAEPPRLAGE
jgi:hypothetical protein